jgi:hypothetical protein
VRRIGLNMIATSCLMALLSPAAAVAQTTTPIPKPLPFPTSTPPPPPPTAKPVTPAATAAVQQTDGGRLDPRLAGVPVYQGAELLSAFDTGRGQQVFLLGIDMPYSDVVAFYKTQFRASGSEVFRAPAMHQFDLGPFRSDTMAYRPGVVVKDYAGTDASTGYLHVTGVTEKRYRTVIQIVPATKTP